MICGVGPVGCAVGPAARKREEAYGGGRRGVWAPSDEHLNLSIKVETRIPRSGG